MGSLGGLFSGSGNAAQADIQAPASTDDAINSYNQNKVALQQQQNLLTALQGQNGLQNQSSVFNQLQGVANGTGPNPAQAMLNQQTGANVANQAALMAGQRGAGANVGLMARQAGQQGGAIQQQAVGQGATMQANQSLNALGQLGGLANTQVANQMGATNAYTSAQQAEQGNILNAIAQQNSARVGSQTSVNSARASTMAPMGGLAGGLGNSLGAASGLFGGKTGTTGGDTGYTSNAPYNPDAQGPGYAGGGAVNSLGQQAPVGPQSSFGQFLSSVNAPSADGLEKPTVQPSGGGGGMGVGGLGSLAGAGIGAIYGLGKDAFGALGSISKKSSVAEAGSGQGEPGGSNGETPSSDSGTSISPPQNQPSSQYPGGNNDANNPFFRNGQPIAKGGMVDVVVSPGEKIVSPGKAEKAAGGKIEAKTVPGEARVAGDSYANDTVKTKLPAGSIVVPRTKANDDRSAASFVRSTLAKRGRK